MFGNSQPKGGDVSLTINPQAQNAAYDGLRELGGAGIKGSVVALDPSTGALLAMASSPTYNPNDLSSHRLSEISSAWERLNADENRPMLNRSIQERFPPGSTFKLVTAAAALSSGQYTPESMVPGGAELDLPLTDDTLPNDGGGTCGGERVTLTQALMVSCNVAFGWLGMELGDDALREQAEKFGFGDKYLDDLNGQVESVFPAEPDEPQTALSAIGQFEVAATPLQMAMVTGGIANGGTVMKPYLVDEVRSPNLDVLDKASPEPYRSAVSSSVARDLTQMMIEVVDQGTGTTAQIPGIKVAGKTGTAQTSVDRNPYAWFVSFAPADDPQVAVAVLIEDAGVARDAISGSGLAAPIAKRVMEAVIR
jgi:peptidoglycan glycosyltransferase